MAVYEVTQDVKSNLLLHLHLLESGVKRTCLATVCMKKVVLTLSTLGTRISEYSGGLSG